MKAYSLSIYFESKLVRPLTPIPAPISDKAPIFNSSSSKQSFQVKNKEYFFFQPAANIHVIRQNVCKKRIYSNRPPPADRQDGQTPSKKPPVWRGGNGEPSFPTTTTRRDASSQQRERGRGLDRPPVPPRSSSIDRMHRIGRDSPEPGQCHISVHVCS